MPKIKKIYVCSSCNSQSPRWSGKCTDCGAWNSLIEDFIDGNEEKKEISRKKFGKTEIFRLGENLENEKERIKTGISEFDRVLGGGIVSDSLILLTGDPGIGKSTLTLQISGKISETKKVLYFSGEESSSQVFNRAKRLFGDKIPKLDFLNTSSLDEILNILEENKPDFVVIDSINTISLEECTGSPGSISQVKVCTEVLMNFFKKHGIALLLIGHVTKGGEMAGPQVLAHLVDVVLYFEGDKNNFFKVLRGMKNRFGSTSEIGLFEMENKGLKEIKNPSSFLMTGTENLEGTASCVILEGTRPFLVEIQSLASFSNFPYPKRVASGIDLNRLNIMNAILSKHLGVKLEQFDIFVNTVGGFKISDTSADLALCASIFSSKNKKIFGKVGFIGEVGLSGEIRNVSFLEKRIKEFEVLGFKKIVIPKSSKKIKSKIEIIEIKNVGEISKI